MAKRKNRLDYIKKILDNDIKDEFESNSWYQGYVYWSEYSEYDDYDDYYIEYLYDVNRLRCEKIDELLGLNIPSTIGDLITKS